MHSLRPRHARAGVNRIVARGRGEAELGGLLIVTHIKLCLGESVSSQRSRAIARRLGFGIGAGLLAGVVALPATAQISPPTRDELVPPQAQPEDRRGATLTIDGDMARSACALDNPDLADIRVTLTQVTFTGAEAASDVPLGSAYADYLGRELPISVLCDIRARATRMLNDAGYLAAVEIPEQRLTGGSAELRVVLGRLTALRVRGDAGPSERLLAGYLDRLVGQPVFNTREAERALLLADDIPGLDVRLALRPAAGGAPGDLIGEVAVLRRAASLDLNVQNYGSRSLGRIGALARAELYDLTGMGDRTYFAAYSSIDFDEQQTLQLGHDFLVGDDGLNLGGQITLGWTNPDLFTPGLDVESETVFGTLYASYPFVRTQAASAYGTFGLDIVNQNVDVNGVNLSRDRVRTLFARLSGVMTDIDSLARSAGYTPFEPRSRIAATVEVRQGVGILGANDDCRLAPLACIAAGEAPSRIEQDPTPLLALAQISAEYRPTPIITLALDVEAQFTNDPLPAFEEFAAGNYSIGRGYDPGAITGDVGVGASLEVRYGSLVPAGPDAVAVQPYAFFDVAHVSQEDPSQAAIGDDELVSVGGGVRLTHGRGVQGDLTLAVPLKRTNLQTVRNDVRLLFSITTRLLPWRF